MGVVLRIPVRAKLSRVAGVLSKANLIRWVSQEGTGEVSFRRKREGTLQPYTLQTIKTRSSDDHHIVIGVRPAK